MLCGPKYEERGIDANIIFAYIHDSTHLKWTAMPFVIIFIDTDNSFAKLWQLSSSYYQTCALYYYIYMPML